MSPWLTEMLEAGCLLLAAKVIANTPHHLQFLMHRGEPSRPSHIDSLWIFKPGGQLRNLWAPSQG